MLHDELGMVLTLNDQHPLYDPMLNGFFTVKGNVLSRNTNTPINVTLGLSVNGSDPVFYMTAGGIDMSYEHRSAAIQTTWRSRYDIQPHDPLYGERIF